LTTPLPPTTEEGVFVCDITIPINCDETMLLPFIVVLQFKLKLDLIFKYCRYGRLKRIQLHIQFGKQYRINKYKHFPVLTMGMEH
jgi:hypothetical protein